MNPLERNAVYERLENQQIEIERLRAIIAELETNQQSRVMTGAEFVEQLQRWIGEIERREAEAAIVPPNAP